MRQANCLGSSDQALCRFQKGYGELPQSTTTADAPLRPRKASHHFASHQLRRRIEPILFERASANVLRLNCVTRIVKGQRIRDDKDNAAKDRMLKFAPLVLLAFPRMLTSAARDVG
jgi:hypothetical protein